MRKSKLEIINYKNLLIILWKNVDEGRVNSTWAQSAVSHPSTNLSSPSHHHSPQTDRLGDSEFHPGSAHTNLSSAFGHTPFYDTSTFLPPPPDTISFTSLSFTLEWTTFFYTLRKSTEVNSASYRLCTYNYVCKLMWIIKVMSFLDMVIRFFMRCSVFNTQRI